MNILFNKFMKYQRRVFLKAAFPKIQVFTRVASHRIYISTEEIDCFHSDSTTKHYLEEVSNDPNNSCSFLKIRDRSENAFLTRRMWLESPWTLVEKARYPGSEATGKFLRWKVKREEKAPNKRIHGMKTGSNG